MIANYKHSLDVTKHRHSFYPIRMSIVIVNNVIVLTVNYGKFATDKLLKNTGHW